MKRNKSIKTIKATLSFYRTVYSLAYSHNNGITLEPYPIYRIYTICNNVF